MSLKFNSIVGNTIIDNQIRLYYIILCLPLTCFLTYTLYVLMSIRITIALNFVLHSKSTLLLINMWGFSGRMGVGFSTTCAISAYHH